LLIKDLHAGDVLQTVFNICKVGKFENAINLDSLDTLSLFFSALIHDYKHTGYTNMFMINSQSDMAYIYNGIYKKFTFNIR
jgi:calcium/calmodulin-dependent 3',5'-cyclic nucleotide phosphodiesterase